MPRAKPKPAISPAPVVSANGPVGDVMTLTEAAAYLRVSEKDLIGATVTQGLPGKMIGGEWRFTKSSIQQWLATPSMTPEMRRAAQLAMAGSCKDDPDLPEILEDAMRRRGRPLMEDGTYGGRM